GEAGVHLGADRAGNGASRRVFRPQIESWERIGDILADRQAVPHRQLAMLERRHPPGGRVFQDRLAAGRLVERDHHLVEGDRGALQRQPGAQRPGGIVLVAEIDRQIGHQPLEPQWHPSLTTTLARSNRRQRNPGVPFSGEAEGYSMPRALRPLGGEKARSSTARSSAVKRRSSALRLSRTCSGWVAFGITIMPSWRNSQASAI